MLPSQTAPSEVQHEQDPEHILNSLQEGEVSPYMVMSSQAGHYVGTYIKRDEMAVPCSRISDYMSADDAKEWLRHALETQSI